MVGADQQTRPESIHARTQGHIGSTLPVVTYHLDFMPRKQTDGKDRALARQAEALLGSGRRGGVGRRP
jgi:hypothetical protein